MTINEFLQRLDRVKGPNASGEWMARCPCHDDKTQSLSVGCKKSAKDGKERIYIHCQTGKCTGAQIMAALGVTPRDLIVDPDPLVPGMTVHTVPPPKPSPKPAAKKEPKDGVRVDFAHPQAVYSYTDETGRELFQVCRYATTKEDGSPAKTFRQRMKNADGTWSWSVPETVRGLSLYRLPEVAAAIRDGRPVYVVEGEKDADTLAGLGYAATCNAGGAGKWRDGQSDLLRGADVIILPDADPKGNDYAGQSHAWDVARSCLGKADRVRLVDIRSAWPEIPDKGDITDMVQTLGGAEAMDRIGRQLAATRDFDVSDVPFWLAPQEQADLLYSKVTGYCTADGGIAQYLQGGDKKRLTDFVVIPREELVKDDGVNRSLHFVLDGWNARGQKLGRVTIVAKDLDSMGWVTDKWGFAATLMPGSATREKVSYAIKQVGQLAAKHVTEYNHTGWRKLGGKWCYLYQGGAIGREGVTVDLGERLSCYRLDGGGAEGWDQIDVKDACRKSLEIQSVMRRDIGIALLGTMYLAPLREFMAARDVVPGFLLFLYGETGTHKTTAASLALSHFGNFNVRRTPASFSDTVNVIRDKAFVLKDMPLLVDDFHPVTSLQEKRSMANTAQALSRSYGDGSERGRLNADRTMAKSRPPRSVAVITGEDLPAIGASGLARFFILDIGKGDIPRSKEMTDMQEYARRGWLQKAMRGYIEWLARHADRLPDELYDTFLQYRAMVADLNKSQHDRAPEALACILIGYKKMLEYMVSQDVISGREANAMIYEAAKQLSEANARQAAEAEKEKPSRIFLDMLQELIGSGSVFVEDLTLSEDGSGNRTGKPGQDKVGWMDADYYYLLPQISFSAVSKLCRSQGVEFPISLKALYKHLRADGTVRIFGDKVTQPHWINGRSERVIWVPRLAIDGKKPAEEQLRMTDVSGEVTPF